MVSAKDLFTVVCAAVVYQPAFEQRLGRGRLLSFSVHGDLLAHTLLGLLERPVQANIVPLRTNAWRVGHICLQEKIYTRLSEEVAQQEAFSQVLGVSSTASQAEVKKAYHKLALQLHPDKNVGNEEAKEKFQSLQQIYGILGNPERRKVYDDTGATDDAEGLNTNSFDELYQFYRGLYKEVTAEDIDSFETDYRGSEQEQGDLLTYYKQFTGNMTQVFEWLMCSHPGTDSHRFMDAIDGAIEAGEAKSSKAYRTWAADVKSRKRPKNPVIRKAKKQKSNDDDQALVRAIRDRSNGQAVLSALEEKYCQPKEKSMQRRSQR